MEFAVKWLYSVENSLQIPYQDNLHTLMNTEEFRQLVGPDLWKRMDYIRRCGNSVAHSNKKLGRDAALLCLENLSIFLDYIAYCYGEQYQEHSFDRSMIDDRIENARTSRETARKTQETLLKEQEKTAKQELDLQKLMAENTFLREELSARHEKQQQTYVPKPLDLSEYETRKLYIDSMLIDAGWTQGKDWLNEITVTGMPNKSGIGRIDYVLYDDMNKPLAIIEAKRTCKDIAEGRQQAKLYADLLEKKYERRPVIFLTNGFETRIIDGQYPERKCSVIYSKRDLEKWFNLLSMRTSLQDISVDKKIAGRYYQEAAIKAVCQSFDEKNRRKALLVMATGSGKTRTVMALCKVLVDAGWVKNILFLADRNSLVTQAKRSFVNWMQDFSCTNLVEEKNNCMSRCVFSTYQTMINCIDVINDKEGKVFTCGHFDLIICDEAHRSIYNKYKDIFTYFDALLVGLTATPKDEIDKNTYTIFDLERGVPTYAYELDEAVKEGYLVDYRTREYKTKIMEEGIHYDQLSEEEKEAFDDEFDDDENVEKDIPNTAVNRWLFNKDTIDLVLTNLMREGLKVEGGDKLGKTIIFARNSKHAKAIVERFQKLFPEKGSHFIKQIDYSIKESEHLIEQFEEKDKMPQIAVSVDMLDTGIDVPEILNLVFFKKVRSYAKFCQMIGRGTRLCKDLLGPGMDKEKFLIFDYCNNFEYFRVNPHGKDSGFIETLSEKIFLCKARIARELQDTEYQKEEDFREYRNTLVQELIQAVSDLNDQSFVVKHHLKYVLRYRDQKSWDILETEAMADLKKHIAPIIEAEKENELARRFDYLMYSIELAMLEQKNPSKNIGAVVGIAEKLSLMQDSVPQIKEQKYILDKVQTNEFWEKAFILEMDAVREALRDLIQFLPKKTQRIVYTDFADQIIEYQENTPIEMGNRLENYRKKVEFYLKEHQDNMAVHKLRNNQPLQKGDMQELERILWQELGSKEDYTKEYGDTPVGILVRKITGMDRQAANEAFNEFLNEEKLKANQIRFVRLIVDYISVNGMIEDRKVMMDEPFRSVGSIGQIFENDMDIAMRIMTVIDQIKQNAEVTV